MKRLDPLRMTIAPVLAIVLALALPAHAAVDPGVTCDAAKLVVRGKKAAALLACHAKAATKGLTVDPACLAKPVEKFTKAFAKAEAQAIKKGGHCSVEGDVSAAEAEIDGFVGDVVATLRLQTGTSKCTAAKLKAIGRHTAALFAAHAANTKKLKPAAIVKKVVSADTALAKALAKADGLKGGNCFTAGDAATLRANDATLVDGTLPSCEQRAVTDLQIADAAAAAVVATGNPWDIGLGQAFERIAAGLSCDPPAGVVSAQARRSAPAAGERTASARAASTCAEVYCPGIFYCGPGNEQTNPDDFHPEIGQCLNQACYQHDLCYNPYCVDVAHECYFSGQAGSEQCDFDLKQACEDSACEAADASGGAFNRKATCAVIDYLIGRNQPEICSETPCADTSCNTQTGLCFTEAAQCCVDNNNCPDETGHSCGASCCCCGEGARCCVDNSGCCPV